MNYKDIRIKQEFSNSLYNNVTKAILKTAVKYDYKKYDVVKLVLALYNEDFNYLTNDEEYREQYKLLNEYFKSNYGHELITFEMIRVIKIFEDSGNYKNISSSISYLKTIIKKNKVVKSYDPSFFSDYLKEEKYDELMTKIESEPSFNLSVAILYDKILLNKESLV